MQCANVTRRANARKIIWKKLAELEAPREHINKHIHMIHAKCVNA